MAVKITLEADDGRAGETFHKLADSAQQAAKGFDAAGNSLSGLEKRLQTAKDATYQLADATYKLAPTDGDKRWKTFTEGLESTVAAAKKSQAAMSSYAESFDPLRARLQAATQATREKAAAVAHLGEQARMANLQTAGLIETLSRFAGAGGSGQAGGLVQMLGSMGLGGLSRGAAAAAPWVAGGAAAAAIASEIPGWMSSSSGNGASQSQRRAELGGADAYLRENLRGATPDSALGSDLGFQSKWLFNYLTRSSARENTDTGEGASARGARARRRMAGAPDTPEVQRGDVDPIERENRRQRETAAEYQNRLDAGAMAEAGGVPERLRATRVAGGVAAAGEANRTTGVEERRVALTRELLDLQEKIRTQGAGGAGSEEYNRNIDRARQLQGEMAENEQRGLAIQQGSIGLRRMDRDFAEQQIQFERTRFATAEQLYRMAEEEGRKTHTNLEDQERSHQRIAAYRQQALSAQQQGLTIESQSRRQQEQQAEQLEFQFKTHHEIVGMVERQRERIASGNLDAQAQARAQADMAAGLAIIGERTRALREVETQIAEQRRAATYQRQVGYMLEGQATEELGRQRRLLEDANLSVRQRAEVQAHINALVARQNELEAVEAQQIVVRHERARDLMETFERGGVRNVRLEQELRAEVQRTSAARQDSLQYQLDMEARAHATRMRNIDALAARQRAADEAVEARQQRLVDALTGRGGGGGAPGAVQQAAVAGGHPGGFGGHPGDGGRWGGGQTPFGMMDEARREHAERTFGRAGAMGMEARFGFLGGGPGGGFGFGMGGAIEGFGGEGDAVGGFGFRAPRRDEVIAQARQGRMFDRQRRGAGFNAGQRQADAARARGDRAVLEAREGVAAGDDVVLGGVGRDDGGLLTDADREDIIRLRAGGVVDPARQFAPMAPDRAGRMRPMARRAGEDDAAFRRRGGAQMQQNLDRERMNAGGQLEAGMAGGGNAELGQAADQVAQGIQNGAAARAGADQATVQALQAAQQVLQRQQQDFQQMQSDLRDVTNTLNQMARVGGGANAQGNRQGD